MAEAKRTKKISKYQSFRFQKRFKKDDLSFISIHQIFNLSYNFIVAHWFKFSLLILIFFVLSLILGLGLSQDIDLETSFDQLGNEQINTGFSYELGKLFEQFNLLIQAFSSYINDYLMWFMAVSFVISLSTLWLIRALKNNDNPKRVSVLSAIYFGPAQIIPFSLLAILSFLQILPSLIVADVGAQLRNNGVLQSNLEQFGAVIVIVSIFGFSMYWLVASLFSLIIVSLPHTSPWQAWQSGFNLVARRRNYLILHLLFMALATLVFVMLTCLVALYLLEHWAIYVLLTVTLLGYVFNLVYIFFLYEALLQSKDGRGSTVK